MFDFQAHIKHTSSQLDECLMCVQQMFDKCLMQGSFDESREVGVMEFRLY